MITRIEKVVGGVVSVTVATWLTWYVAMDGSMGIGYAILFWLTVSGLMWGAMLSIMKETPERTLIIAPFLERLLLKPSEKTQWEQWCEEGREMGRAEVRAELRLRLEELGLDPDDILPNENVDNANQQG